MTSIQRKSCPNFHNLYFVGRNYLKHIDELSNQKPEHPLIFTKPLSCACKDSAIPYPPHTRELQFEGEMVFALPGALEQFNEKDEVLVGCGIDFTARDVQSEIKGKGWPWFEAKCFRGSAVVSKQFAVIPRNRLKDLAVETRVNGVLRQKGHYLQTIFPLEELIRHLDSLVEIKANDILFTGTPAGVGPVQTGDRIEVHLLLQEMKLTESLCEVV